MRPLTSPRPRTRLRPLAALGLAAAGVMAAAGAIVPMAHVPSGPAWEAFRSASIVETFGWSPLGLPIALLAVTIAEARRPGRAQWAPLVLGGLMTVAAFAWAGLGSWFSLAIGDGGTRVPGSTVDVDAVPGLYLYGGGGVLALTLGALIIVAPRRMRGPVAGTG